MKTPVPRTQRVYHDVNQADLFQVELCITAAAPVAVKPWARMGQQKPSFRRTYHRWSAPKHRDDLVCAVGQRLVLQRGERYVDDLCCVPMVTGQYRLVVKGVLDSQYKGSGSKPQWLHSTWSHPGERCQKVLSVSCEKMLYVMNVFTLFVFHVTSSAVYLFLCSAHGGVRYRHRQYHTGCPAVAPSWAGSNCPSSQCKSSEDPAACCVEVPAQLPYRN